MQMEFQNNAIFNKRIKITLFSDKFVFDKAAATTEATWILETCNNQSKMIRRDVYGSSC